MSAVVGVHACMQFVCVYRFHRLLAQYIAQTALHCYSPPFTSLHVSSRVQQTYINTHAHKHTHLSCLSTLLRQESATENIT